MYNTNVVVETYYTLEEARRIVYAEMAEDRERHNRNAKLRREKKVDDIKFLLTLFISTIVFPVLMFLKWLYFGY